MRVFLTTAPAMRETDAEVPSIPTASVSLSSHRKVSRGGYTLVMEPDELTEEETLWDALFAMPESLALLTELAEQALLEYLAGQTVPLDELLGLSEESDELCE